MTNTLIPAHRSAYLSALRTERVWSEWALIAWLAYGLFAAFRDDILPESLQKHLHIRDFVRNDSATVAGLVGCNIFGSFVNLVI